MACKNSNEHSTLSYFSFAEQAFQEIFDQEPECSKASMQYYD